MLNPFEQIDERLSNIENLLLSITKQPVITEVVEKKDLLITIQEAAELLHLTVPTIYTKVSRGELPGVMKRGKRLYFSRDELIKYIQEGRKKSNAEIEAEAETYLNKKEKGPKYGN